ncbi:putative phosphoglycerate mutase [Trueperella bonasi]|uniref:Phosphoglycerate mutase n=1 Tax=Trueperella bonasi TaxID=312286 RepID=A0ABT9NIQ6_9ACTO|nr:histidine phosphatase family protein [Trueperella bonasi]MDP9807087.1 putative phosphoglycerate mutase [Trueperella bonasi]
MRLVLVRHGQTYKNASHTIDTVHPGAVLTEEGWTQANDVVAQLLEYEPGTIWASNLTRTQQTATPLATRLGLDVNVHEGFREIEAGDFEGCTEEEDYRAYSEVIFGWARGEMDVPMPGTEVTGASVLERFDDAVRAAEQEGASCAVVFAHGAVISYWVGMRGGVMVDKADFVPLVNTGVVVFDGSLDEGYQLKSWMHIEFDPDDG